MLKKKIAATVAAIMTISSLGIVAYADVAAGQTYDQLLGNELIEGTFENGVNVGADRWVPTLNVKKVMENTYDESAGAILADQSVDKVYSGFSMKSNRKYHAEAYIKLYNNASDKAQLVLATKNDAGFTPIASTAVKTDVSGARYTKLEGDFIRYSLNDDTQAVYCYIELENEAKFYLDNVIIKDTNCTFPSGTELVSVEGESFKAGKLVADSDGKASAKISVPIEKGVQYKLSAWVKLDAEAQAIAPTAHMSYKSGRTTKSGAPTTLDGGWNEAVYTETVIAATGNSASREITLNITAAAGDIVYFRGISVQPVMAAMAETAEVTTLTLEAMQGANTNAYIAVDADTVALRYFYSVIDENNIETKIKTGHTDSGDTTVPPVYVDASYAGKKIKLVVEPMNADLVYGDAFDVTAEVKEPFSVSQPTVSDDAVTFDISNCSGSQKSIAALVAYYNEKGEMVGIGIDNKLVDNNDAETYTVSLGNGTSTGNYKIFVLDGTQTGDSLALFPLGEVK